MKYKGIITIIFIAVCLLVARPLICLASQGSWTCADDDATNGIYRICNYFPLDPGDQWTYTTGNRFISNNTDTCESGYSGILYATTTYEYSSYIQNQANGLLIPGCTYDGNTFKYIGGSFVLIPPEMTIGETSNSSLSASQLLSTTFVGVQTITVPAGTFNTIKMVCTMQDIGKCSYKETLWFAKDIGLIKIQRSDANPSACLGCIFICDPNDDVVKLNTPAELVSYTVTGAPGLWQDAKDVGSGWKWLSWFGYFSTNNSPPWIYHAQHGWLYPFGTSTESIWFWDSAMNAFWWTSATVYPYVYRANDKAWLWYEEGTSNPRWFNNLNTGKWEKH